MKNLVVLMILAMLMQACHSGNNLSTSESTIMCADSVYVIPGSDPSPPAMLEMVKFAPPSTKDDATESGSASSRQAVEKSKAKKIIKDGNLTLKTENIQISKRKLDSLLKSVNAYYENEEFDNYETRSTFKLKIRVASENFDVLLGSAQKGIGEVTYKSINTRDVTAEYIDGEIRLTSKKLFRKRYNELLSKAGKVVDILAIEENIRVLQEEIESQEGQLKYLDDQVNYSTLELLLFQLKEPQKPATREKTFFEKISSSLTTGKDSSITFLLWLVSQWPVVLCTLCAVFIIRIYLKKRVKKS